MKAKLLVLVALLGCKGRPSLRTRAKHDIHDKCVEHVGHSSNTVFCLGYYTGDLTICTSDDGCLVVPAGRK